MPSIFDCSMSLQQKREIKKSGKNDIKKVKLLLHVGGCDKEKEEKDGRTDDGSSRN